MENKNITNLLKENMVFKNYKELCKYLNWKVTTGTAKKAQLKQLETMCEYHKEGNSINIDKVFKEPKVSLGSGLYKEDIEMLLLDLLARKKDDCYKVSLTTKNILKELEMVNDNFVKVYSYGEGTNKVEKLSDTINVDIKTINDIVFLVKDKNKRSLQNALKDLADKSLIIWEIRLNVCKENCNYKEDEKGNVVLQKDGQPYILRCWDEYRHATEDEKRYILQAEKEAMIELNVKKKTFFNINKEAKATFNKLVHNKLKQYNIKFYYYTYDIIYNKKDVLEELGRVKLAEVRNRLNKNILRQVEKTINSQGKNVKNKYSTVMGLLPSDATEQELIRVKDTYEKNGKKTAKAIVDRKSRIKIN